MINSTWTILYKNYRGLFNLRIITVKGYRVGKTPYYPNKQLLIDVYDHDREDERVYSAANVLSWIKEKKS